jgi:thiamine phosphate synthase YjbQ (UPF0047 family)
MKQAIHTFRVPTTGQALRDTTRPIRTRVSERVDTGPLTVWSRHISASLRVQQNAEPDVQADTLDFVRRIVPERHKWLTRSKIQPRRTPQHPPREAPFRSSP